MHAHLERGSVRAFEDLAAWLERHAAPSDLIDRCRLAAADEVVHARLLTEWTRRCGGWVPPCEVDVTEHDLLSVALSNAVEGCVFESFAALVAAFQADHADDEELRRTFRRIAADELRHGQLAWDLHTWLLGHLTAEERERVEAARIRALVELEARAASNALATPKGLGWPPREAAASMARHFASLVA